MTLAKITLGLCVSKLQFPNSWEINKSLKRGRGVWSFRFQMDSSCGMKATAWWCALRCSRSHWWWLWWCTVWSAAGWGLWHPRSHCVQRAELGLPQREQRLAFPPILAGFLITHNDPRAEEKDLWKKTGVWKRERKLLQERRITCPKHATSEPNRCLWEMFDLWPLWRMDRS